MDIWLELKVHNGPKSDPTPLSFMPAPKCSLPQLGQQKEFHIAPMLDVSTIEFRYFMYVSRCCLFVIASCTSLGLLNTGVFYQNVQFYGLR